MLVAVLACILAIETFSIIFIVLESDSLNNISISVTFKVVSIKAEVYGIGILRIILFTLFSINSTTVLL